MNIRIIIAVVLILMGSISNSFGQSSEEILTKFRRKNFSGWGGIVFRCMSLNKDYEVHNSVCKSAEADAELIAAIGKIPFTATKDSTWYELHLAMERLGKPEPLKLELELSSIGAGYVATSIRLRACSSYALAIELGEANNSPKASARAGSLVLWEINTMEYNQASKELSRSLSITVSRLLKNFFSAFIEGHS